MYSSLKTYPRQPIARNWWCKRFQIQSQVGRCRRGSLMQFKFSCFRIFGKERKVSFSVNHSQTTFADISEDSRAVFDGYVTYPLFFNYGTPKSALHPYRLQAIRSLPMIHTIQRDTCTTHMDKLWPHILCIS